MTRITIIVPQAYIADANQLGRVVGQSAADDKTYGAACYQDAQGTCYAIASGVVGSTFVTKAQSTLVEPAWGADMVAALRAQSIIQIHTDISNLTASPNIIFALVDWWPVDAITALGLTPITN